MKKILRILEIPILDIIFLILVFFYGMKNLGYNYIQIILFISGLGIWIAGWVGLGKRFHLIPTTDEVVTKGVYSKIRHPIYLGSTICCLAVCLVYKLTWMWVLLLALIALQIYRALIEEKKLGEKYLDYKKSTWF